MRMWYNIFCVLCIIAPSVAHARPLPSNVVPFPVVVAPANPGGFLQPTAFPKTLADLSFSDRMALKSSGYEPFKDMKAYHGLVVEGEEHFIERQMALMEMERQSDYETMTPGEYCDNYPLDAEHCAQTPGGYDAVVAVGNAENPAGVTYSGTTIGGGAVVANNKSRGGSCYPAAHSKDFKNQILTTGRYERISPAFEKAMITIFRKEGRCGYIAGDPCGYTCYGIGEYCLGKSIGIGRAELEKLTRGDAEDIYYKHYWQKYNIGVLPDAIAGDVFLAMMASGAVTGIRQFRNFLGVTTSPKDKLDENVAAAVMNYNGDIHNNWLDVRQDFLVQVAARKYNNSVLKGWMRAIKLKRENGCHVIPSQPLLR